MGRYKQPFTIFKRGKYWYYRTYDARGVRTTAKTTGKTSKSAALNYLNMMFREDRLFHSDITFGEYSLGFFDKNSIWIKEKAHQLKESTRISYCGALNNITPFLEKRKMIEITQTDLKRIRSELRKKYVASHVNYIFIVTGIIFKQAYLDNIIQRNPFTFFDSLPRDLNVRDALTKEEIKNVYYSVKEEYRDLFLILALTGMRAAEGVGLIAEDVKITDSGLNYIYLYRQRQREEYLPLKNNTPRNIPIIPELVPLIKGFSFQYPAFYKWTIKDIKKQKDAEKRKLCVHSIRHFFITDSKASGINPLIVECVAGHSLKGIQQVYTNFNVDQLSEILKWQKKIYDYIKKEDGVYRPHGESYPAVLQAFPNAKTLLNK